MLDILANNNSFVPKSIITWLLMMLFVEDLPKVFSKPGTTSFKNCLVYLGSIIALLESSSVALGQFFYLKPWGLQLMAALGGHCAFQPR